MSNSMKALDGAITVGGTAHAATDGTKFQRRDAQ